MPETVNVYNILDGDAKLSRNFSLSEFACKDGSPIVFVDGLLVWILQNVRDHFGKPITITSAYRTVTHNGKPEVGGEVASYHCRGMAADFVVKGVSPGIVQEYLEKIAPNTCGIGRGATYTHIDTRAEKSRWTY